MQDNPIEWFLLGPHVRPFAAGDSQVELKEFCITNRQKSVFRADFSAASRGKVLVWRSCRLAGGESRLVVSKAL